MSFRFNVLLIVGLVGCGGSPTSRPFMAAERSGLEFECTDDAAGEAVVTIVRTGSSFHVRARIVGGEQLVDVEAQRPALNVRIEDGPSDDVREFVDFNDAGLEVVPVDGPRRLEIDLGTTAGRFEYALGETRVSLACQVDSRELTRFLGVTPSNWQPSSDVKAVAFDIDDTLLFTSPAFARGFATGGTPRPSDVLFWTHTNGCDQGCAESSITLADGSVKVLPANVPSTPKAKALELIKHHRALGHAVYAITARPDINGEPLRAYLAAVMGIEPEHVFFEPDLDLPGNAAGKTDRIESLDLDVFYGDSDSDITDARKAFAGSAEPKVVEAVRFLRSPKSSNRKAGQLNKYHPGYFGEPILSDSY